MCLLILLVKKENRAVLYWWDGTPTEKFKTPSSSSHNRLLEWCLQMCFVIFFPIVILCLFKRFSSIFCFFCRFQYMDGVYSLLSFFLSANWLFQISPLHKNIYSMLCVYPLKLLIKSFRWKSMTLLRLLIIIKDVSKGTFDLVRAGIFTLHLVFILLLLFHSFKKFFSSHYALTLLSHHVCVVKHKANMFYLSLSAFALAFFLQKWTSGSHRFIFII